MRYGQKISGATTRCMFWSLVSCVVFVAQGGCSFDDFKSADALKADVQQALNNKNYSLASASAKSLTEKSPDGYEGYYFLAEAKAQVGDKNAALIALEQAIKKGLKDDVQIDKDALLDPIKQMVAYRDLMQISFPSRNVVGVSIGGAGSDSVDAGSGVSIQEINGKNVVRAGDVVVEMPSLK